ncbi:MAG TPA: DEAD/DEAH box helicase [Polyangiaceae bacterium]|nr:DEAD/DEAH box helicase [Polyangiaceae bacterium]
MQPAVSEQDVSDSPFTKLGLVAPLVQAVLQEGYSTPTPIQEQTIPTVLEGRDLLGCAQTGTGKTAAFMLPLLQRLGRVQASGRVRALVLSPTRELAAQISERAGAYGRHFGIRHAVIYGGVSQRAQERELARRPDLLVATPGRLMDLMRQGHVQLKNLEILVLDEADTMLDMGFIHDVRRIIAQVPQARQTLLFSATMPAAIEALARSILNEPARVSVTPQATTAETVEQAVYFVSKPDKRFLLERVLRMNGVERALVFTRTKHGADRVSKQLVHAGIEAAAIHGNKSQNARERALDGFRRGTTPVLVATDIAARGIDVQGISHVINYDLPNVAESYVHRIGRTGRAGAVGRAISFCDHEERSLLVDIERLIRQRIRVGDAVPRGSDTAAIAEVADPRPPFDPDRVGSQNGGGSSGRPFRSTQRRPTQFRPRSGHS